MGATRGRLWGALLLLWTIGLVALGGCATAPHSMVVGPRFSELEGEGHTEHRVACAYYLFGLIPIGGDASLDLVTKQLLAGRNSGSLAYMTVDEESAFYLVATGRCTKVKAVFVGPGDGSGVGTKPSRAKVGEPADGSASAQPQADNAWVRQRGNCDSEIFADPGKAPVDELARCVRLVAVYRMDIDKVQGGYRERLLVALRRVRAEATDDTVETARYLLSRLSRGAEVGE